MTHELYEKFSKAERRVLYTTPPSAQQEPKLRHSEVYVSDLEDSLRQIADALGVKGGADDLIAAAKRLGAAQQEQGDAVRDSEDAARYRWLRNHAAGQFEHPIVVEQHHEVGKGMRYIGPLISRELDKKIDAALRATNTEGKEQQ